MLNVKSAAATAAFGATAGALSWAALSPAARVLPRPCMTPPSADSFLSAPPVLSTIYATNVGTWLGWQFAKLQVPGAATVRALLSRHAMTSVPALAAGRWHTLLTSAYSHMGLLHMGFNMLALNSFGRLVLEGGHPASRLSTPEFLGLYNVGALVGGIASHAVCRYAGVMTPGLGASGAVFAVAQYALLANPGMGISIMFVPMDGVVAIGLLTAVNVGLTIAMLRGGASVDGAAHLGGQAVGALLWAARSATAAAPAAPPTPPRQARSDVQAFRSWGEGGLPPLPQDAQDEASMFGPVNPMLTPAQTDALLAGVLSSSSGPSKGGGQEGPI